MIVTPSNVFLSGSAGFTEIEGDTDQRNFLECVDRQTEGEKIGKYSPISTSCIVSRLEKAQKCVYLVNVTIKNIIILLNINKITTIFTLAQAGC